MKWLFLSCHTGEGHNSAARAIIKAAEQHGIDCILADPLSFGSEWAERAASNTYNSIIQKAPAAFGVVYRAGELFEKTGVTSPVFLANALYAKNLKSYLQAERFDAVICTHLYGMEAMTAVRKRLTDTTPCFGVLTDYACIPFFAETELDRYFIPHADLMEELVDKGMDREKLLPTGIPVSLEYANPRGKAAARNALVIPEKRRVYLVMSGGMGSGNLQSICDSFAQLERADQTVYVLVGRNDELCEKLRDRYRKQKSIQIITFTTQVYLFMEAADVLITKPGGLSSTEAITLGIPMIHLLSIPGCETRNADFFVRHGMSLLAESPLDAVEKAIKLVEDPQQRERMKDNQRAHAHPDAAKRIVDQVIRYAK